MTHSEQLQQECKEWREHLDRKYRYLCNKAKSLQKFRRKTMAIGATTAENPKGWTRGVLVGFKESKAQTHIIAHFRLETGDFCSMPLKNPLKLKEINPLMVALGLQAFEGVGDISLPEQGDEDMMGMDNPILIDVVTKGDWLNAKGFKAPDGGSNPPF